jgi:glycosyltransferase involved in cell wall biosynthesis
MRLETGSAGEMPRQRVRVLQLIDGFAMGGAERIVLMLARHSDPERFEVIPCALHRSGPLEEEMKAAQIPYRILGMQRRSLLTGPLFVADVMRILSALTRTIRELAIDVVHTHLTESTLLGVLASRGAGCRVCASLHNVVIDRKRGRLSPRRWLMGAAINNVFSKADRIVSVSEEVAQAALQNTKIPRGKMVTIPNAVDSSRFRSCSDRNFLRAGLGLPVDRAILITVGRLTRQKGYTHLLAALSQIPATRRPLTLLVGEGEERQLLERQAIELGLAFDVRFLGNRRDVPDLLAAADVFVLSSIWEGLSLALLEAMAAGLPAVVTSVGGNVEVIEDGRSGLIVPPSDEPALAAALVTMLDQPLRRTEMGEGARKRFHARFSLRGFIEAHERLYQELHLASGLGL